MWKRPLTSQSSTGESSASQANSLEKTDPIAELLQQISHSSDDYAVQIVERILQLAASRLASDIHLDAVPDGYVLRLRIDGQLHELGQIPKGSVTSVTSRLKSLAGLLTYRQDIPQEGRLTFGSPRREARVVTFPTLHGERTVIRVVAGQTHTWQLTDLGLTAEALARHEQALDAPSGVVVVCGAVGAGKTTTAYAAVRWLAQRLGRCVVTLEDPIECEIASVAQAQIDPNVGFDWNVGLRSLLRQDPEAIFIGEIRDAHTAQIAFRASMSGQLVVTTMHARSVCEAWLRLLDMQVPSQHLISGLRLLTCQQLLPRACDCQTGCPACQFTGTRGRQLQVAFLPPLEGNFARLCLSGCDLKQLEKACRET